MLTDRNKCYTDKIWLRRISFILVGNFLYGISSGINVTILPLLFENHGISRAVIGMLFAAEMCSVYFVTPFLPRLTRRFGPPATLLTTAIIRNCLLLILPFAGTKEVWFPLMFIFGAGSFTMFTIILFWVNSISNDSNRGVSIASINLAFSAGIAVGPIFLGVVGIDDYPPFIFSALFCFSSLIAYSFVFDSMPRAISAPTRKSWSIIKTSAKPLISGMYGDYIFFSLASFIVLFGISLGLTEIEAASLVTFMLAGGILIDIPVGLMADRYNKYLIMAVAGVVALISVQFLPFMATKSYYSIFVFMFITGAMGAAYVCALSILGQKFTGAELITSNSIYVMFTTTGGIIGLVVTGAMMELYGHIGLIYSISLASILFLSLIFILFVYEKYMHKEMKLY